MKNLLKNSELPGYMQQFAESQQQPRAVVNTSGHFHFFNSQWIELLGYPPSRLLQTSVLDYVSSDNKESLSLALKSVTKETETREHIVRVFPANRKIMWLLIQLHTMPNTDLVFIAAYNVTNLKRQLDLLEGGQEIAKIGSWEYDPVTNQVLWSNELQRIYGVSDGITPPNIATGLNFYSPQYRDHMNKLFKDCLNLGHSYDCEAKITSHHGQEIWVRCKGEALMQGKSVIRIRGTIEDISERKKDEMSLAEIVDNMPVALFAKNAAQNFSFTIWNRMAEKVFGYDRRLIVGKTDYDLFPQEEADFFRSKDIAAFAVNDRIDIAEEKVSAEGRTKWLRTIKIGVRDEESRPLTLIGITTDITELREQEQLIRAQEMKMVASAKLSALGVMAGGIAHEINNPLSIILGKSFQLKNYIKNPNSDDKMKIAAIEVIEQTVVRIGKIIKGLRSFARNAEQDPMSPCKIKDVVDDTLEFCREKLHNKGISLDLTGICSEMQIMGRPAQLSQVVLNLISNSADAIEKQESPWIRLSCRIDQDSVHIVVEDSGTGIPKEVVEKMMNPFFTTKELGRGTGLGLSIAKGIIADHNGELYYDSAAPHTTFVIQLPKIKT